ncbi:MULTISPECIES: hypothetical protein [Cyanophyceae]|uniref:hypothetical protein n=1 Tax=Cyanophyceae TaxID=3028117 RepID=UPI001689D79A|nr:MULTISPECIES: hypothetical protein [Cyanophyceae]MBD1918366.1 hypothetical protein [Phormidium sp. FACHB-77]MBD2028765.1 hypothetical protein [Phormidium sp. FACHB-322]MBD2051186.1 hypothetical protein [Leptolyngbya sp. FACHB-60]
MPNLFQKLAGVESVFAVIETRLGLPQRCTLLFRHQFLNDTRTASTIKDYLVVPRPYITSAPPRLIGLLIGNVGLLFEYKDLIEWQGPHLIQAMFGRIR